MKRAKKAIVALSIAFSYAPASASEADMLRSLVSEACLKNVFRCNPTESFARRRLEVLEDAHRRELRVALYNRLALEYNVAPNLIMALCEEPSENGLGRESECAETWASAIAAQLPQGWNRASVERFLRENLGDTGFETVSARARDLTFLYWPERVAIPNPENVLVLNADERGQFYAPVTVNGHQIEFLVDTGASVLLLAWDDAKRIGINPSDLTFDRQVWTASGIGSFASITVRSLEFAGERFEDVVALVAPDSATDVSLLGTPILGRFQQILISGDSLIVRK